MARMLWCLVGLLCLAGAVDAMGSAGFDLSWNVMGGGGGTGSSPSYSMESTIGQVTGVSTGSDSYLYAGYWVPGTTGTVPLKGNINVSSVPDSAIIILNGAPTGILTNASIEHEAGVVTVSVEKPCYHAVPARDVMIESGKTAEVVFELSPDAACPPVPEYPDPMIPLISLIAMTGVVFLVKKMVA